MTTDPAERLAELMASPEIPSIKEYAKALAATFPPITDAPEEPRRILRAAHAQAAAANSTTRQSA